jgi:hypothetical protein
MNNGGILITDSADRTPEPRATPEQQRLRLQRQRTTFEVTPLLLIGLASLLIALLFTALVYGFYQWQWRDRYNMTGGDWFFLILLSSIPFTAFVFAGACLLAAVRGVASVWRMNEVTYTPGNMPITYRQVSGATIAPSVLQLHAAAAQADMIRAERSQYQQLSTLSLSNARPEAMALPEPTQAIQPVPVAEWMRWIDRQPHVLLAAETGGGKSTTAKAVLAPRIEAGENLFIIDPHASEWFDLPSVGGGENWREVQAAMQAVYLEYKRRQEERAQYYAATGRELPVNHWQRLTVVLDEANNARAALDTGKRGTMTPWQQFALTLGSGARKVRISVILLAQSANVDDIGISGAMRDNFCRIALDSGAARKLITSEEPNAQRRKALYAALDGKEYPAVCEMRGAVYLLDRTDLDKQAQPLNARACVWRGWDYAAQPDETDTPQTDGRTDGTPFVMTEQQKRDLLVALRRQGVKRDEARDRYAIEFSNDDWTVAGS